MVLVADLVIAENGLYHYFWRVIKNKDKPMMLGNPLMHQLINTMLGEIHLKHVFNARDVLLLSSSV